MIYFLFGENVYARDAALAEILGGRVPEKIDGDALEKRDLPDIFAGQTLFAAERLIVIKNASENTEIWTEIEDYLEKIDDSTTLIFVDTKPDKRTRTFKLLKKLADTREFAEWTPRDHSEASHWIEAEAKKRRILLDKASVRFLLDRAGVNQERLAAALDKLELTDEITPEIIAKIIDTHPEENVFDLLETALRGDSQAVQKSLAELRRSEDAYRVFGLLSSQVLQLAALVFGADKSTSEIAADMKMSPFVLNRLAPYAARLTTNKIQILVEHFTLADKQLKSSTIEPWTIVEVVLLRVASV